MTTEFRARDAAETESRNDGQDALRAAARAAAHSELRYDAFADEGALEAGFRELMESGRFVPAAQILRGAQREGSPLSACCVLPVEDSMEGIFTAVKDAALVRKYGVGVGFSLSRLRPEGADAGGKPVSLYSPRGERRKRGVWRVSPGKRVYGDR